MIKYDKEKQINSVRGALELRTVIEPIVDAVSGYGFKNLCFLGIGGTWASCLQVICHMKEKTTQDVFSLNSAEYNTTGDKRIGKGSVIVISSVTGTTIEIIDSVKKALQNGAFIIGFIDNAESELASLVSKCITYPSNEQLKFFMVADRFLYNWGEMDEYEDFYNKLHENLPEGLVEIEEAVDDFANEYAKKHYKDNLHYFVGAGTLYGSTYSYAMCYWEEMHWIRTKSIHSAELFHGMLEIIDNDTPITLFIGEDSQRPLGLRVAEFLPKVCSNATIIDTADYALKGIDTKYRPYISHLIMHAVTNRIDAHIEGFSGHDMKLRRYYRKMDY